MGASNGAATVAKPEASTDVDEAAQRAEYAENGRKAIDAATWRKFASAAMVLALLALVGDAILANKYTHDVFVFERTPHGLVYNGEAAEELTAKNFDIASQLGYWVRAKRDVPGDDLMVDRNVELLEATTADVGQDHALSDLKSELSANNPKIERKDYTRSVDPNVDALHQPGTNTWDLSWIEYVTTKNGVQQMPTLHHGYVVILPDPRLPTDNEHVNLDPAGVKKCCACSSPSRVSRDERRRRERDAHDRVSLRRIADDLLRSRTRMRDSACQRRADHAR